MYYFLLINFQSCCIFCGVTEMLLAATCSFSLIPELWIKILVPVFLLVKKKRGLILWRIEVYCFMRSTTDRVTQIGITHLPRQPGNQAIDPHTWEPFVCHVYSWVDASEPNGVCVYVCGRYGGVISVSIIITEIYSVRFLWTNRLKVTIITFFAVCVWSVVLIVHPGGCI
jgi:hypothetical protein